MVWTYYVNTPVTSGLIDYSHIPDRILKLYVFIPLFETSCFPYNGQNGTRTKSNEKANEFEYNFLIICKYLNLVENQTILL